MTTAQAKPSVDGQAGQPRAAKTFRVALLCDSPDEGWLSMDVVANSLHRELHDRHSDRLQVTKIAPDIRRVVSRASDRTGARFNADRLIHRFWDYPKRVKSLANQFDLYHIVDHSYAQLALELPGERTVVTCHDLEAFRCLLEPKKDRSIAFRPMAQRILNGFRKAARVICVSAQTRRELLQHRLVPEERTVVIPNGIDPVCRPQKDQSADEVVKDLLGPVTRRQIDILNVGSTAPRKRIGFLLELVAAIRRQVNVRLIRVGGAFTAEQANLVKTLGLSGSVVVLPFLTTRTLAAVYRHCAVAIQTSEREGFGLPVAEAMACGTPVIASDIDIFREVGGDAITFCQIDSVTSWTEAMLRLLEEKNVDSAAWAWRRARGLSQARSFSWVENARKTLDIYDQLRIQ